MLNQKLQSVLLKLDSLIEFTKEDIKLVKEAKHDSFTQRVKEKERLYSDFERAKNDLNNQLLTLSNQSQNVQESITEDDKILLNLFKEKLEDLKSVNSELGSIVIVVSEFYNSLFGSLVSFDTKGYQNDKPKPAAVLRVSA